MKEQEQKISEDVAPTDMIGETSETGHDTFKTADPIIGTQFQKFLFEFAIPGSQLAKSLIDKKETFESEDD